MNLTVHQCITIQQIRIDSITNSSHFQIGTAGVIKSLSNLYNTGGFPGPAPQLGQPPPSGEPLVPLPSPVVRSQKTA
ncbi:MULTISPECIES: spore germination protein GerPB [unclassified Paenibacillus]|uniref:spore germination protein GerPB n=1 Tax=unclassified Paenibacillus TaxID=185978 RepID=UPI001C1122AE|nr:MULTISPECIES: spore germination protein GerPB [unclassified Paenibacillus]MBU5443527.1 spore germination protein GerPB [Paenibacillus sp. MSJ-34]CAH0120566.1 putative spore germination protein GerPB [Paenibacillus sp. CECT 9249]